jgi:L-rhamnose mutarotase
VKRFARIVRLRPEKVAEYKALHRAVWPGVLATIARCRINNYSIFLKELEGGAWHLFAYFEYHGEDFEADMQRMAADPQTREWWKLTDPCQEPIATRASGEWWAEMEEVFHCD